jgi:plasmid replication initiation protein
MKVYPVDIDDVSSDDADAHHAYSKVSRLEALEESMARDIVFSSNKKPPLNFFTGAFHDIELEQRYRFQSNLDSLRRRQRHYQMMCTS